MAGAGAVLGLSKGAEDVCVVDTFSVLAGTVLGEVIAGVAATVISGVTDGAVCVAGVVAATGAVVILGAAALVDSFTCLISVLGSVEIGASMR